MPEKDSTPTSAIKKTRASWKPRPFPTDKLEDALAVVQAIAGHGAGRSMDRLLVANALRKSPSSSAFRVLLSSSYKYGLTVGTEKSSHVAPTELGLRIIKPVDERERIQAIKAACMQPELMAKVYRHFDRTKLPKVDLFRNTLERTFGVDHSHVDKLAELLVANARFAGILRVISGAEYIWIDSVEPNSELGREESIRDVNSLYDGEEQSAELSVIPLAAEQSEIKKPNRQRRLFVAHGKKHKPLEDLKKILDSFKIPYVVAKDEPHAGRPISQKVADLMNDCTAGIFIFTKDEKFQNEKGEEIWRPSENVVYELGAASILWGTKIIILRESGVNFPSDFSDLGYITFEDGGLASKALDLLKELVGLELVKVEAA